MKKPLCVFISLEKRDGHILDDSLCKPCFESAGWRWEEWAWTENHPWSEADLLVFRSCYDYWERESDFREFLQALEGLPVVNALPLIHWNLDKTYLFKLEELGIPLIKSCLISPTGQDERVSFLEQSQADKFVIKPCVGAGGFEMKLLDRAGVKQVEVHKPFLLQEFQSQIDRGEWSVIFFGQSFSHVVLKRPKSGEYRVQDSHGGETISVDKLDHPQLLPLSQKVMTAIKSLALPEPVYSRFDFLLNDDGELVLVEVELLEPSLFLSHSKSAPGQFTKALLSSHSRRMAQRG